MTGERTTIERAIELAKSGSCATINDIRKALRAERFDAVDANLSGHFTKHQLNGLINEARRSAGDIGRD
ncbi:MAG: hypothetical protein ACTHM8_09475 [Sphingomonas sp.]